MKKEQFLIKNVLILCLKKLFFKTVPNIFFNFSPRMYLEGLFLNSEELLCSDSVGGGLDFVGFGLFLSFLAAPPPPNGLLSSVPSANSALKSHLIIVSLTAINQVLKSI